MARSADARRETLRRREEHNLRCWAWTTNESLMSFFGRAVPVHRAVGARQPACSTGLYRAALCPLPSHLHFLVAFFSTAQFISALAVPAMVDLRGTGGSSAMEPRLSSFVHALQQKGAG